MKRIIVYALMDRRGGIENFFINYKKYFKNIHLDFIKLVPDKLPYENELLNQVKIKSSKYKMVFTKNDNSFVYKEVRK